MGKTATKQTKRSAAAGRTGSSGPAPSLQVGALCWRLTRKGAVRVLLITSLDTGRWIIPKGWPMRRRTDAEAAAREAWEEAGIVGEASGEPLGFYSYGKVKGKAGPIPCVVRVFPIRASRRDRDFPEVGQRRLKWFSRAKAARKVDEPDLARLIRDFKPEGLPDQETAEAPGAPPQNASSGERDDFEARRTGRE